MAEGFQALGELLAGGVDRQGAFNEGLLEGSKAQEALAKARIRVDEAKQRLELEDNLVASGEYTIGQAKAAVSSFRAGAGNILQSTQALGETFEQDVRQSILDEPDIGIGEINRRRSAIAPGGLLDPFQFGPGGELFSELLGPEAGDLQVSPTGKAQIGADVALTDLRAEKTAHPERFRAPGTTVNVGGKSLSEQLLGEDDENRISVIPEGFDAEEAFGLESIFTTGINKFTDMVGLGNMFEASAVAREVIGNLEVRTKSVMLMLQDSGRSSKHLMDLFGTYAAKPTELFNGDEAAIIRLENTVAAARRFASRTATLLDRAELKSTRDKLSAELFSISDLVTDYEDVLDSMLNGPGEAMGQAAGVQNLEDWSVVTTDAESDTDDLE